MSLCHILPFCHLDDSEFALAMYDFHNVLVSFDHDWLANLLINLLISNLDRYLIRSDDLDPDFHVNFHSHCNYFIQDKLNDTLRNELNCDYHFWIFYSAQYTKPLQNKVDDLTVLLSNSDITFSIAGIAEAWLQNSSDAVDINGANLLIQIGQIDPVKALDFTYQILLTSNYVLT